MTSSSTWSIAIASFALMTFPITRAAAQPSACSALSQPVGIVNAKSHAAERRDAFALLRAWPDRPALLFAERTQATKDSIVKGLQMDFGTSLPRVLLSLFSASQIRDDPMFAAAAVDAYVYAGYSEEPLEAIAAGQITEVQRLMLFSALRRRELPLKHVGPTRTMLVCMLAQKIIQREGASQSEVDTFKDLVYLLWQEGAEGSMAARRILRDSTVQSSAHLVGDHRITTPFDDSTRDSP